MLEDGRLTDSKGRVVDFTNAMIALTSNVGSREILEIHADSTAAGAAPAPAGGEAAAAPRASASAAGSSARGGRADGASSAGGVPSIDALVESVGKPKYADAGARYRAMRQAVLSSLRALLRPEILNRLDELVVFEPLASEQLSDIIEIMLADLGKRTAEAGIAVHSVSPALKDAILADGYAPAFGARPLRRAVQRWCEDAVADAMLVEEALDGEALSLDVDGDGRVVVTSESRKGLRHVYAPAEAQGIEDVGP